MEKIVIFIIELIGTVAFAWSGAMTGIKKGMDIFGVSILGLVTAVGGGVIRDLILGITPPTTFTNPVYALTAIAVAMIAFLPFIRRFLLRHQRAYERSVLVMDSLGLGIFTAVGVNVANMNADFNFFLFLFVGVITGVGGGVLRDVMSKHRPYIFVKHFYACASIIGAVVTIILVRYIGNMTAMLIGGAVVVILRLLAAHFRWSLPKAHDLSEEEVAALTQKNEKEQKQS